MGYDLKTKTKTKNSGRRVVAYQLSTQKPEGKKYEIYTDSYRMINPNSAKLELYMFQKFVRYSSKKLGFLNGLPYSKN